MKISLIWAMADNRVIGIKNQLPWKLPADMKWFRKHTLGKTIIMGRKTFESFGGKSLPDRKNIVISHDETFNTEYATVCRSIESALKQCEASEEVMVIGGMSLYKQTLPIADKLYMTVVAADIEGDAWFPDFDRNEWTEIESHNHLADDKNSYDCVFKILQRKTGNIAF